MQQINSIVDVSGNSMPVLVVGTHADKLSKTAQEELLNKMSRLYPVVRSGANGVQGHYGVSFSSKSDPGLLELKVLKYIYIYIYIKQQLNNNNNNKSCSFPKPNYY